jgi:hypothetical protein
VSKPVELFSLLAPGGGLEVAPLSSRRILVARRDSAETKAAVEYRVVLNWTEELRRRK